MDTSLVSHTGTAIEHEQTFDALTIRQRQVLRIVVEEFVAHAQPVGSRRIAKERDLGVSSATIRNDLAQLEALGLLTKPHASAGRVPSLLGYRIYVLHLIGNHRLPKEHRNQLRRRFEAIDSNSPSWLLEATRLLSVEANSLALATDLRYVNHRLRHVELISVQDNRVLMIVVLEDGHVCQRMLDIPDKMAQADLTVISAELNHLLPGLNRVQIQEKALETSSAAKEFCQLVSDLMPVTEGDGSASIVQQGLGHILDAPEFAESRRVRKVVDIFDSGPRIEEILMLVPRPDDVHVLIAGGDRKEWSDLADISLVLSAYGIPNQAIGIVGVVGPVRMAYRYNMGTVRFMAALMSARVREIRSDDLLPEVIAP